ncbi:MAG: hypothetical protein H0W08_00745 [Acidobacteria bacterium]|nr:hypothetical protein [Acidobacteriota bacterium]
MSESTGMGPGGGGAAPLRYQLRGPQIEPAASYWMYCARLRLVNIEELTAVTDNAANAACHFPDYDPNLHGPELKQLKTLQDFRDNPAALNPGFPNPDPAKYSFPPRKAISRLWNLMPPPMGAVLVLGRVRVIGFRETELRKR